MCIRQCLWKPAGWAIGKGIQKPRGGQPEEAAMCKDELESMKGARNPLPASSLDGSADPLGSWCPSSRSWTSVELLVRESGWLKETKSSREAAGPAVALGILQPAPDRTRGAADRDTEGAQTAAALFQKGSYITSAFWAQRVWLPLHPHIPNLTQMPLVARTHLELCQGGTLGKSIVSSVNSTHNQPTTASGFTLQLLIKGF